MIGLVVPLQIEGGSLSVKPYDDYNPRKLFPFVIHTAQTCVIVMGATGILMLVQQEKNKLMSNYQNINLKFTL